MSATSHPDKRYARRTGRCRRTATATTIALSALLVACALSEPPLAPSPSPPPAPPADPSQGVPPDALSIPVLSRVGGDGEGGKALYGRDGRIEVIEAGALLRRAAESVAALFHRDQLTGAGAGRWRLPGKAAGTDQRWCPDERFIDQPRGATCTAFLIGPRRIATSAHCVRADDADPYTAALACSDARFVFGYDTDADGRTDAEAEPSRVYRCNAVLDGESSRTGADWRVVELDRSVRGRSTLPVYAGERLPVGTPLSAIGHPNGLPAKVAGGGRLVAHREAGYFVTDLDTYGGNSGSPVLATVGSELAVVGVLSRGAADFETVIEAGGACERSRRCEVGSCGGEHATLARRLAEWPTRRVR